VGELEQSETDLIPVTKPTQRVVAVDPGGTTGYAVAYIIPDAKVLDFTYGQHAWREGQLWDALRKLEPDWLICESFEYRQQSRAGLDLTPAHLIGVVRLFAELSGCKLQMQTAAQGKGYYSDRTLKNLLIYDRHFRHGRDAARHLLHWFTFGAGFQYNSDPTLHYVQEQYLFDSYFNRVVL
jgi:hypothetical protein